MKKYNLIATAAAGIEAIVGNELRHLGYEVQVENGRVRFQGTIEDILETGTTLKSITELLQSRKVNSLEIATLLDKPNRRKADIEAKYVGKKIPDEFVVGYGLDYRELYRNLPYIGTLKAEVYSK